MINSFDFVGYLILPTLSVMYFDQLLQAARYVHVVYLNQLLGAALSYMLYLIAINVRIITHPAVVAW